MNKKDIENALNVLTDLTVDYGNKPAEEIKELDNALDTIQQAAQAYCFLGADSYKNQVTDKLNKEYARGYAESRAAVESILEGQGEIIQATDADFSFLDNITIRPKKGEPLVFIPEKLGYWEPVDDPAPRLMPMKACTECQRVNYYPGRYCTYCGSDNLREE